MNDMTIPIQRELYYEKSIYAENLKKTDCNYLKQSSELFLIHAYTHLLDRTEHIFGIGGIGFFAMAAFIYSTDFLG
jgi:hypothetical protein